MVRENISMEKMKFLNTYVSNVTMDETIAEIEKYIKEDKKRYIVAITWRR